MNTQNENRKCRLIEIFSFLLEAFENDIESGIEDGTYKEEDNAENRALIKEAKQAIQDFTMYQPEIYISIEGYNIQGILGTEKISVNKFDLDDFKTDPAEQEMTEDEWTKMIDEKINSREIKSIY